MRNFLLFSITVTVTTLAVYAAVLAFTEPAGLPPGNNVPAPVNVGPDAQNKAGDLEVAVLTAREGVAIGDDFRSEWPTGCAWEGTKCFCRSDSSSVGDLRVTIGLTCSGGQLTNFDIKGLDVSTGGKTCNTPGEGFPGCDFYANVR